MKHWKLILIAALVIAVAFLWKRNAQLKSDVLVSQSLIKSATEIPEEPDVIQPPVEQIEKEGGGNIVKQEVIVSTNYIPESVKRALSESYLKDTVIAALKKQNGGKDIAITSITRLLGEANAKLTHKDLVKSEENDKAGILEWKTPYYSSRVDIENKTNDTRYNIITDQLQITETGKGFLGTGLFRSKKDFMVGTSPDPSATFSGMLQMKTPIKVRKDFMNLSAELGATYFLKPSNILTPFAGIRVTINPDGKWQPSFSGQYIYDPTTGRVNPMIEGKIAYTIFE